MLLSVVVPVYNGEKYLKECLESLSDQGLSDRDYEVLVVNDGSTDSTEAIIDSFCQVSIFKKINKINGGVSSARNLGIEKARGEFITFVDADDKISENIYAPIIAYIIKNKLDGYYFGKVECQTDCQFNSLDIEKQTQICDSKGPGGIHSAVGAIYKKKILIEKQIVFNESMSYLEDLLFNFYYTQNVEKVGNTQLPLYYVRNNPESVTRKLFQNKDTYGNPKTPEYKCYSSLFAFVTEISKYRKNHSADLVCQHLLSVMTGEILWIGMRCFYDSSVVLNDIKKKQLSLKNIKKIKIKRTKNFSFKMKLKSWIRYSFRYPIVYKTVSLIYRKIK